MEKNFVSRGGIKLQAALGQFSVNPKGLIILDVGSSTGGFVDCLLQNGASKVYAVDTSYGELAWKLRHDPRLIVLEKTNILHLDPLPEKVDLITIDAGWTKLELVLPLLEKFAKKEAEIIALLKPQYEINQKELKKGIVPQEKLEIIKNESLGKIKKLGFNILGIMTSPITGKAGNTEFLLYLKFNEHS